ncbi:MAG: hypothetical protein ACOCQM_00885 [Natronomonas sp.]
MSRLAIAALALTLLLAGCGQFGAFDSQQTGTATPVPLEEGAGTGISDTQVTPDVVAAAHAEALTPTNYTLRIRQRTSGPDGRTLRTTTRYREVGTGGTSHWGFVRYNATVPVLQEFGTVDYWRNESHVATRFDSPLRQVRVGIWRPEDTGPIVAPSNAPTLRALLIASDADVAERFSNDTVRLTGSSQYPGATVETPPQLTDVRNVSGDFRVRADGVITEWRFAYDATFGGERVRVVRTGRIESLGSTTVERPEWVADATSLDCDTERINGRR